MPGAILERGERVTLRVTEREDARFLQRSSNPELRYPIGGRIRNQEEIADGLGTEGDDHFLVCLDGEEAGPGGSELETADVEPIGSVSVVDADYKRPELRFWLVPEAQGEGYGADAVSAAIDYAFRNYPAPTVTATAYAFNDASRGLLESLGFEQEGRKRDYMYVDGEWVDAIGYALGREQWDREAG